MKKGFSIGRDKVVDVYHDAEHFDVTKDAKKLILRIVLWNALILVVDMQSAAGRTDHRNHLFCDTVLSTAALYQQITEKVWFVIKGH